MMDLAARHLELSRAVDRVLLAEHGQRHWLKEGHPPFDASLAEAVKHYGEPNALLDLWMMCAAVDSLRRVWTGESLVPRQEIVSE